MQGIITWDMGKLQGRKAAILLIIYHLSAASQLGVGPHEPLPSCARVVTALILYRLFVGKQTCCEFMSAK